MLNGYGSIEREEYGNVMNNIEEQLIETMKSFVLEAILNIDNYIKIDSDSAEFHRLASPRDERFFAPRQDELIL